MTEMTENFIVWVHTLSLIARIIFATESILKHLLNRCMNKGGLLIVWVEWAGRMAWVRSPPLQKQ
jgi:hypothetical protein